jgi:hypothetical protein
MTKNIEKNTAATKTVMINKLYATAGIQNTLQIKTTPNIIIGLNNRDMTMTRETDMNGMINMAKVINKMMETDMIK